MAEAVAEAVPEAEAEAEAVGEAQSQQRTRKRMRRKRVSREEGNRKTLCRKRTTLGQMGGYQRLFQTARPLDRQGLRTARPLARTARGACLHQRRQRLQGQLEELRWAPDNQRSWVAPPCAKNTSMLMVKIPTVRNK